MIFALLIWSVYNLVIAHFLDSN